MKRTYIALSMILCGFGVGPVLAEVKKSGSELFDFHGCVNCHGAEAKNPVSKVVPSLAGEPADELYVKAKKILSGEGASEEAKIMHAAFYSPAQCDAPPTDEELHAITQWVSKIASE